jgi:hypothetical protein
MTHFENEGPIFFYSTLLFLLYKTVLAVSRVFSIAYHTLCFIYHIRVKMSLLSDDYSRQIFFKIHNGFTETRYGCRYPIYPPNAPTPFYETTKIIGKRCIYCVQKDTRRSRLCESCCAPSHNSDQPHSS